MQSFFLLRYVEMKSNTLYLISCRRIAANEGLCISYRDFTTDGAKICFPIKLHSFLRNKKCVVSNHIHKTKYQTLLGMAGIQPPEIFVSNELRNLG